MRTFVTRRNTILICTMWIMLASAEFCAGLSNDMNGKQQQQQLSGPNRRNNAASKKLSGRQHLPAMDGERSIESDIDTDNPYIYSYMNTRSLGGPVLQQQNYDSCHLNIECKDAKDTNMKTMPIRLPIHGPKGDPGPPGMTGQKGERGEPGIAGIPARDPPPPNFTAFFAALDNNIGPFKQDKDLVFANVITNYGQNYDSTTGVFTAPFNGIYQFIVTISATGRNKAGVNVMKNTKSILTVWSESEPWSTSSQTIIVRLAVNDRVFLRLLARASHVHGYMYSSFGGSLLFEELNIVNQSTR